MSYERINRRLKKMKSMADPSSPEIRQALLRIGQVLKAEIRINIGREKIIDRSGLITSIDYRLDQSKAIARLQVGSFGIKYAAINEFGGPMTQKQVRAMFAALRERGKVPGRVGGKGVVTINKDQTGFWRARPFIRPAFQKHAGFIVDLLREIGKA